MNNTHEAEPTYTVSEVAAMHGITVRTLHHWDNIGLVSPTWRSWSDYRLYTSSDIERIQNVLVYRETGMSLQEIAQILAHPHDTKHHLQQQRELLLQKSDHLQKLLHAIDKLLEVDMTEHSSTHNGISPEERARILGTDWNPEWETEAKDRWGDTPEYMQSQKRIARMDASDWQRVKTRMHDVESALAQAMERGMSTDSPEAHEFAEAHRELISEYFTVSHNQHVLIARGYTNDPRFFAHYEKVATGLATWLRAIIESNAAKHGVDIDNPQW